MKKTLLLVFIHGFKGSDNTFGNFPQDIRSLLSLALPKLNIVSVQYPQYETRGDLHQCVQRFKEWLQNKVIDFEVENRTPSPTVDPSVHVILCGHSMGGIVAAETLLSIAKDEPVPLRSWANDTTNTTTADGARPVHLSAEEPTDRPSSAPPPEPSRLFFPFIKAILAFDTPYLGISPGVLAHGAEDQLNHAAAAYKAFDTATQYFGWGSTAAGATEPIANASTRALPPANASTTGWGAWGKYALYGGAIAAVAGAAGAAYLNRNQIQQGLEWAGSHLEFVGCLARGAELQKRVESLVELGATHRTGFANLYAALGEKVSSKTQYAGAVLGQDRTFCVVPKAARQATTSAAGSKRNAPSADDKQAPKRRRTKGEAELAQEMQEGEKVHQYVEDTSRSKGDWVKCTNTLATDELRAHTSMFSPSRNSDYRAMLPRARDMILEWVDKTWYEDAAAEDERTEAEVEVDSAAE